MSLRTGEAQFGIEITRETQTGAERNRRAALHGVGIGVDDLTGDTVAVEGLITLDGIPSTGEFLVVLLEPLLRVLLVAHTQTGRCFDEFLLLEKEFVELLVVLLLEVRTVLIGGQTGMAVGGDDQVRIVVGEITGLHWNSSVLPWTASGRWSFSDHSVANSYPANAGHMLASAGTDRGGSPAATSDTRGPMRSANGRRNSRSKP